MRGYLDKNLTVGFKRERGKSGFTEKNADRLKLARDLLRDFNVFAKINPDKKNPTNHLRIEGYQDHKNLRDNLGLENPDLLSKLDNLIENPRVFIKYEGQEFNRLGNELGKIMNSAIDHFRPNTIEYKLKDNRNIFGQKIKVDKIRQHSNGRIEGIDWKLRDDNVKPKDKNYLSNKEITDVTAAYWYGTNEKTEKKFGKDFHRENLQKFRDKLRQDRDKAQQVEEREEIDRILDRFDKFEEDLKKEEEKELEKAMKDRGIRKEKRDVPGTKSTDIDKPIEPIDRGNKQEGGESSKAPNPENNQQIDKSPKSETTKKEVKK